jgi:hypothetical protein
VLGVCLRDLHLLTVYAEGMRHHGSHLLPGVPPATSDLLMPSCLATRPGLRRTEGSKLFDTFEILGLPGAFSPPLFAADVATATAPAVLPSPVYV